MITLEPQLEQQIKSAAAIKGLSGSELIEHLFFDYQQEQEALKNTDELAFTHVENAAQYSKQLRSSAWNRNNQHG